MQEASYLPRDRAGPPSARSGGGSMTPFLSVVLCTHNPRRTVLEETLAALRRQQPLDDGGWELIIIDNASTPPLNGSIDLSGFERARIVREERLGLTHARLRGLAEASGEILVFVDDDNLLDETYLRSAAEAMSADRTLGAIGGKSIARYEAPPPPWFGEVNIDLACRDLGETAQYASWEGVERAQRSYPLCAPIGAGLVIRRDVFAAYASAAAENQAASVWDGGERISPAARTTTPSWLCWSKAGGSPTCPGCGSSTSFRRAA